MVGDLIEFAIEFGWYVVTFWLFILSPGFRRDTIAQWRSRSGIRHVRTALEIVGSTLAGTFFIWIPLLWLWLVSRS